MEKDFDMSVFDVSDIDELRLIRDKFDLIFRAFDNMENATDKLTRKYHYHIIEIQYLSLIHDMSKYMEKVSKRYDLKVEHFE